FPADVSMQPFVPAIVLRMAGPTALQINPQGHPPGRQPAQSQQPTHVSKGTAVVAPDGSGQSITFKQSLETLANRGGGRIGQAPQFQHVTAVFVPDRQGFASLSLPVIPPAFEVDGPHFIGGKTPALAPQSACFSGGPPAAARFGQSRPLQDPFETALRSRRAMAPQIQLPQLACSPMSVGQFEPYDFTHHRFAQLAGVTVRPTRLVRHAVDSPAKEALAPLVSRLGADAILLAQRAKVVRPKRFQGKLSSLIHRFILFPGHPREYSLKAALLSVTYVLNHARYLCSEPAPCSKLQNPRSKRQGRSKGRWPNTRINNNKQHWTTINDNKQHQAAH